MNPVTNLDDKRKPDLSPGDVYLFRKAQVFDALHTLLILVTLMAILTVIPLWVLLWRMVL